MVLRNKKDKLVKIKKKSSQKFKFLLLDFIYYPICKDQV